MFTQAVHGMRKARACGLVPFLASFFTQFEDFGLKKDPRPLVAKAVSPVWRRRFT